MKAPLTRNCGSTGDLAVELLEESVAIGMVTRLKERVQRVLETTAASSDEGLSATKVCSPFNASQIVQRARVPDANVLAKGEAKDHVILWNQSGGCPQIGC